MEEMGATKEKETNVQFVIWLVISIIGFCGALVCLLLSQYLALLVFIVIHAVADLALMIAIINSQSTDEIGLEEIPTLGWLEEKEELERAKAAAIAEKEELQKSLNNRLEDNDRLSSELKQKNAELLEVKSKLNAEEESRDSALKETKDESSLMASILPPSTGITEVLNISDMAQKAVDELRAAARKANVEIVFNPMSEPLYVKAEPDRIRILFRNIIDNSIKYMGKDGNLVITISTIEDMIFIVLKDNGLGLPTGEVSHIFELNYQGSNRVSGNGLGLSQAKAIVDYYGGNIYAKSSDRGGMGIYIQLPANQA